MKKAMLVFFVTFFSGETASNPSVIGKSTVRIQAFNPYAMSVHLEVKCDWDGTKYRFYKKYVIPKKRDVVIETPSDVRHCEVWPKIKWF